LDEGKAIEKRDKFLKLYTNCGGDDESSLQNNSLWGHVLFEHPPTFETLAMEPSRKQEIMEDLITFTKSRENYSKIGKPWKCGYLLYGPPETVKSTMIIAMAKYLQYNIFNLELRWLLIETTKKSIIVIEDISLDLTG
jgi:SpoVK/Ycf46/Vps4 family AAA+-type ATPase